MNSGWGSGSYYCSSTSTGSWGSGGMGGGWGGLGGGYTNPPGTPAPRDQNNRPIIAPACNVPPEYDCPLFENRPHDGLIQALDALSYAMSTEPECQQQQNSISYVQQNTAAIKQVLGNLQYYMDKPDAAYSQMATLEQSITAAVQAAGNIGQLFSSNSLLNSSCGKEVMSGGKVLLAINDILNGLAPYALMATAANPAIGGAATFAITGGAMATSAISSIVKMIEQGTVDMTNPEHRKAVLKNTCQYTKIARKVRFMQLAQSGQIQEITKELDQQVAAYRARFGEPSQSLQATLDWSNNMDTQNNNYDGQIRRDNFEMNGLEMQMKEAEKDDLYTCLIANELVRRSNRIDTGGSGQFGSTTSTNARIFPTSVFANLEAVASLGANTEYELQISSIRLLNEVSRKRVMALEAQVMGDDASAIQLCAQTARSWVKGIRQALTLTTTLLNAEKEEVNQQLLQNPEYAAWKQQADMIKTEEQTVSRVARVMKELAKDTSVIDRSELDQKINLIKGALFGNRGAWKWGRPPIHEWLEHTLRLHGNRISSFQENIRSLQTAAYQIRASGKLNMQIMQQMAARKDYQEAIAKSAAAANLDTITLERVPIGTRGHEIACQMMETTWLDWAAAIDHLGATDFMCDLVDGYIDNKVEKAIVNFCRGEIGLDSRQIKNSRIQDAKAKLTDVKRYYNAGYGNDEGRTYRDWAILIAKKMNDMKCPLPPISVMNGD